MLDADVLLLGDLGRGGEKREVLRSLREVVPKQLIVQPIEITNDIVNGVVRLQSKIEGLVARLQIEIDNRRALASRARQRRREVGGQEGRAATTLAGVDCDDSAQGRLFGTVYLSFDTLKDLGDLSRIEGLTQEVDRAAAQRLQDQVWRMVLTGADDDRRREFLPNPLDELKGVVSIPIEQNQRDLGSEAVHLLQHLRRVGQLRDDRHHRQVVAGAAQEHSLLLGQAPSHNYH